MAKQNGKTKAKTEEAKAAYFLSLTLSNVRCFGSEQTLDLSDGHGKPARWTVLLGENGTGKTTLLKLMLLPHLFPPEFRDENNAFLSFAHRSWDDEEGYIRRNGHSEAALVKMSLAISQELHLPPLNTLHGSCELLSDGLAIHKIIQHIPKCFGYGAARRFGSTLFAEPKTDSSGNLFNDQAPLRDPEDWLLRIDHAAARKLGKQEFQLNTLRQLLIDILPDIEDINFETGEGFYPKPHVDFKTPYGWVPMRQLGYGYQSMITWIVDLATRLFERYPESENPLAEPAVVLVDEIDLHLHPRWQRELMIHLTKHFPNTQFIVTAHSPLIVQGVENANIAVLKRKGDHVEIINDVDQIRNWRVDQILTSQLFGLETARPPYIEELLLKRKQILSKSELSKADKKKLKELEDQIGELPIGESTQEMDERKAIWKAIDFLNGRKTSS